MSDSARERATELLHKLLEQPYGTEVRRAAVAAIVNELIAACVEETPVTPRWSDAHATAAEEAIAKLDEQIGQLIVAVRHLSVDEFAECSSVLHGIKARRRYG